MAAPTFEVTTKQNTSGGTTASCTISTTQIDDIIMVVICTETAFAGVEANILSISSTSGLTWHKRAQQLGNQFGGSLERWWAHAPLVLINEVVTCTFDRGIDDCVFMLSAWNGCNLSAPFDTNAGLPAGSNAVAGGADSPAINTTSADSVLLSACAESSAATFFASAGWSTYNGGFNNGGTLACAIADSYMTVSSAQSGTVMNYTGGGNLMYLVDALVAGSSPVITPAVGAAGGAGAAAGMATVIRTAVGAAAGHGSANSHATGIIPSVGMAAGVSGATAIGQQLGVLEPPFDWEATVISQYQTSATLLQLIENLETYIDPLTNLDAFYVDMWNVYSASGYGLDVWGRIVGVTRIVQVPSASAFLGFEQAAPGVKPFDFGIFFDGSEALTQNYTLTDDAFRTLILAKALANICNGSIPAMNQILINLFNGKGYGNVYVTDGEDMTMTITFTNAPSPVDLAIISTSGVFPRPAGVSLSVVS